MSNYSGSKSTRERMMDSSRINMDLIYELIPEDLQTAIRNLYDHERKIIYDLLKIDKDIDLGNPDQVAGHLRGYLFVYSRLSTINYVSKSNLPRKPLLAWEIAKRAELTGNIATDVLRIRNYTIEKYRFDPWNTKFSMP